MSGSGAQSARRGAVSTAVLMTLLTGACERAPEAEYLPDAVLRGELGLTDADRVHTVTITGGEVEIADPALDSVPAGAWVQFVSGDWRVHELRFDADSLAEAAREFLTRTDQWASPPLLQRDARFVVSFEDAPAGRYPYRLEGNGGPGRGLIVVVDRERRR